MKITIEAETPEELAHTPEAQTYSLCQPFALAFFGKCYIHGDFGTVIGALARLDAILRAKLAGGETVAAIQEASKHVVQVQGDPATLAEQMRNGRGLKIARE